MMAFLAGLSAEAAHGPSVKRRAVQPLGSRAAAPRPAADREGFFCDRTQSFQRSSDVSSGASKAVTPPGICFNPKTGAVRSLVCAKSPTACRAQYLEPLRVPSAHRLENPSLLGFGSPDFRICLKTGGQPELMRFDWHGTTKNVGICWQKNRTSFASTGQVTTWVLEKAR